MSELDDAVREELRRRAEAKRAGKQAEDVRSAAVAHEAARLEPLVVEFLARMRARRNPGTNSEVYLSEPRIFGRREKHVPGWRLVDATFGNFRAPTYYLLTDGRWVRRPHTYTSHPSYFVIELSEVDAPYTTLRDVMVQLLADHRA